MTSRRKIQSGQGELPFGATMRVAHEAAKAGQEVIAPRELVEGVRYAPGDSPGLAARRTLLLLLAAAAGDAWQDRTHRVTREYLSQGHKAAGDTRQLLLAIDQIRLMIPVLAERSDGPPERATQYVGLFDRLVLADDDTWVEYQFRGEIRRIFASSSAYASLSIDTLRALESQYSVTLYGLGSLVISRRVRSLVMTPAELILCLGMPDGTRWHDIERKALRPTQAELNLWAAFALRWNDHRRPGQRQVRRVTLFFEPKDASVAAVDGRIATSRADRREVKKAALAATSEAERKATADLTAAIQQDLLTAQQNELIAALDGDEIRW